MSKPTPVEIAMHRHDVAEIFNALREGAHAAPTSRAKTVLAMLDSSVPTSAKLAALVGFALLETTNAAAERGDVLDLDDDVAASLDTLQRQLYLEDR